MTTFYEIRNRSEHLVAIHKRVDQDDGTKSVTWLQPDGTVGLNGTPVAELPLYNIHRIDRWIPNDVIVIVEGEKVAQALVDAGIAAVGTVTGAASTPSADVLADLTGHAVILSPDNDDAGLAHMRRFVPKLVEVAAVGWLEPPDGKPKGWNLADALDEGLETQPLDGKVAIITGASSGIGRAMARALARRGSRLVLVARSADDLEAVAAALDAETQVAPADVAEYAAVRAVVDRTVDRFGRVDIMFANAGVYFPGQFVDSDPAAWSKLLDVNIDGVLNCAYAVLDQMRAQGSGDILVTSSIAGHSELRDEPIYSPSKHAVQTFVHTVRRQVAAMGIRVGSIAPGSVATELWGITDAEEIDRLTDVERTCVRAEDVAAAAVFMLSQPPHVTIRDLVILPQAQDI